MWGSETWGIISFVSHISSLSSLSSLYSPMFLVTDTHSVSSLLSWWLKTLWILNSTRNCPQCRLLENLRLVPSFNQPSNSFTFSKVRSKIVSCWVLVFQVIVCSWDESECFLKLCWQSKFEWRHLLLYRFCSSYFYHHRMLYCTCQSLFCHLY